MLDPVHNTITVTGFPVSADSSLASGEAAPAAVRSHACHCCLTPQIAMNASCLAWHCDLHELGLLWFCLLCTPLWHPWHLHTFQPQLQHHQRHHQGFAGAGCAASGGFDSSGSGSSCPCFLLMCSIAELSSSIGNGPGWA